MTVEEVIYKGSGKIIGHVIKKSEISPSLEICYWWDGTQTSSTCLCDETERLIFWLDTIFRVSFLARLTSVLAYSLIEIFYFLSQSRRVSNHKIYGFWEILWLLHMFPTLNELFFSSSFQFEFSCCSFVLPVSLFCIFSSESKTLFLESLFNIWALAFESSLSLLALAFFRTLFFFFLYFILFCSFASLSWLPIVFHLRVVVVVVVFRRLRSRLKELMRWRIWECVEYKYKESIYSFYGAQQCSTLLNFRWSSICCSVLLLRMKTRRRKRKKSHHHLKCPFCELCGKNNKWMIITNFVLSLTHPFHRFNYEARKIHSCYVVMVLSDEQKPDEKLNDNIYSD